MANLVERIRAAIDEDEQDARDAEQENWRWYAEDKTVMTHADQTGEWDAYRATGTRADAVHIARHDPERVLRMVAAHRKLLGLHELSTLPNGVPADDCTSCMNEPWPCDTLRALAAAYGVETT